MENQEALNGIMAEQQQNPAARTAQRKLADELTTRVHSQEDLQRAKEQTEIIYGTASNLETFKKLAPEEIEDAFDTELIFNVSRAIFEGDLNPINLLGEHTAIFPSKGEARKSIQGNGVSINKEKLNLEKKVSVSDLLFGKYLLVQKGKKNYYLVIAN
jgi:tyrosyl-tRNA synthetase